MAEIGGSIESVTLEGRTYTVASDADVAQKLGGFENEVQANGDGGARKIMTRVPWGLSDITVSIDPETDDLEFLQSLANTKGFIDCTLTEVGGTVWQGSGTITGEMPRSLQATTAAVNLMGQGKLTKQ